MQRDHVIGKQRVDRSLPSDRTISIAFARDEMQAGIQGETIPGQRPDIADTLGITRCVFDGIDPINGRHFRDHLWGHVIPCRARNVVQTDRDVDFIRDGFIVAHDICEMNLWQIGLHFQHHRRGARFLGMFGPMQNLARGQIPNSDIDRHATRRGVTNGFHHRKTLGLGQINTFGRAGDACHSIRTTFDDRICIGFQNVMIYQTRRVKRRNQVTIKSTFLAHRFNCHSSLLMCRDATLGRQHRTSAGRGLGRRKFVAIRTDIDRFARL